MFLYVCVCVCVVNEQVTSKHLLTIFLGRRQWKYGSFVCAFGVV